MTGIRSCSGRISSFARCYTCRIELPEDFSWPTAPRCDNIDLWSDPLTFEHEAAMKPGDHSICLWRVPDRIWPQRFTTFGLAEQLELDDLGDIEPTCGPFCGAAAGELRNVHDRAVHSE